MASRSVIGNGVVAGLGFMATAWARAWAAMAVAGGVVGSAWALGLLSPGAPWRFVALLICLATVLVAQGALYRLALDAGRPGPGGLQWERLEWRLAAVLGLSLLFLFILGLLAFVVVMSFAFALASAGRGFIVALPMTWAGAVDGRGRAVMTVVAGLAAVGLVWAATRISLGPAASVATGRIQVLASWPKTRGLVLPIVAARVVLGAVPIGVAVAIFAWTARGAATGSWLAVAGGVAGGICLTGGWLPTSAGLMAYLYRNGAERSAGAHP
jgi:hypothetical protein